MTTAAKKRATKPRKAAQRVAANGSAPANGSTPRVSVAPPDASAPGTKDPWHPAPRDPEEFVPTTKPEPVIEHPPTPEIPPHPYGEGAKVFTFFPKDGSPAIVFPHITTVKPTYHFMWRIRKMDQVHQSMEWMDLSGAPDSIQERVALLPDEEQATFFLGWFSPAITPQGAGPPGES
jgi:hypothetical protein